MTTSICKQSEHDSTITINATYNGYYLSKSGDVDSPLNLISDDETRKMVMDEAYLLLSDIQASCPHLSDKDIEELVGMTDDVLQGIIDNGEDSRPEYRLQELD